MPALRLLSKLMTVIGFLLASLHPVLAQTSIFPGTMDVHDIDTQKLLAIMNQGNGNFIPVAAHRGYWRNVPENGRAAIRAAFDNGVESAEIDVRLATTGDASTEGAGLAVSHDECVDRQTGLSGALAYAASSKCSSATGYSLNSYVNSHLRDRHGNLTPETAPSFSDLLLVLHEYQSISNGKLYGPVLIVDLKDKQITQGTPPVTTYQSWEDYLACLQVMESLGSDFPQAYWPAVIFKLKMNTLNAADAQNMMNLVKAHPAYGHVLFTINPEDANSSTIGPVTSAFQTWVRTTHVDPVTNPTPQVHQFELVANNGNDAACSFIDVEIAGTCPNGIPQPAPLPPGFTLLSSFGTYYQPSYYPEGVTNRFAKCCVLANLVKSETPSPQDLNKVNNLGILDFATYYGPQKNGTITSDNILETLNYLVNIGARDVSLIQ